MGFSLLKFDYFGVGDWGYYHLRKRPNGLRGFRDLLRFSTERALSANGRPSSENLMAKAAQNCSAAVVLKILIMDDHGLYIEIEHEREKP